MRKVSILLLIILCIVNAGCVSNQESSVAKQVTSTVTDSIGRKIQISKPLTRVVVSNGYNLELINAIGALDTVIGVDNIIFKNQDGYHNKFDLSQVIGQNTNELNYEKIIELNPEALIITGNGSWETAEKKLAPFGIQVVVLDAYYTGDFKKNWRIIGELFGKEKEAQNLVDFFEEKLSYIEKSLAGVPKKTLYYEYKRVGNTTAPGDYFYKMVILAGAENIFDDAKNVEINPELVILRNPEYIVRVGIPNESSNYIPPCQEDFRQRKNSIMERPGWDEIDGVKKDKILILSHYAQGSASKLIGTMYIAKFLYPEHLPDLQPEEIFKEYLEKYQKLPYQKGHTYPEFKLKD